MKQIAISCHPELFALVDDEDFERANQYKWRLHPNGYASHNFFNGRTRKPHSFHVLLHRFILNAEKGQIVDHINRNPLDCQKQNLRLCTFTENLHNKKLDPRNKLGVNGVHRNGKAFMVTFGSYPRFYKSFRDLESAKKYRRYLELKHWGEFAPDYTAETGSAPNVTLDTGTG